MSRTYEGLGLEEPHLHGAIFVLFPRGPGHQGAVGEVEGWPGGLHGMVLGAGDHD